MTPSPRQITPASTTTPSGRAMVRDVGAGNTLPARFDVRTAFDFAISMTSDVGEHDELPAEDRKWLERARAALPDRVRPAVDAELCIFGTGLIVDRPDVTDATAFVELLRQTPGREFAHAVLGSWPEHKHGWLSRILGDSDEITEEVTELLTAWLPLYQEIEPKVAKIIERDVALRAGDRSRLGPAELIERTTNGIRWLSEPGVRRVVLAPSYLARPYNFTFAGGDWRMFVYPVSDAALEPTDPLAPPVGVLRLHRALGDETRLRILRLLRDRDWYLTEIAERLELSKPTIKHHLAQLRAAGLVTLTEEGGLSYYSLRRDRLDDASSELKLYLS